MRDLNFLGTHSNSLPSLAVLIELVGQDLLELSESNLTLTLRLEVTGFGFGAIPLTVYPVSYADFEVLRASFGVDSTLEEVADGRAIPPQSAQPCECRQSGLPRR